jgi:hypothetical protein
MKYLSRGNYSDSHKSKGMGYEKSFEILAPRKVQWNQEKEILRRILDKLEKNINILDIATGTGRIAGFVKDSLNSASVMGIDNSTSMLKIAKGRFNSVDFRLADFRSQNIHYKNFDLITAFRFFGKADYDLIESTANFIDLNSKTGTILVLNNHNSDNSISKVIFSFFKRELYQTRSDKEIVNLMLRSNFKTIDRFSIGVTLQTGERFYFGRYLSQVIEFLNFKYFSRLHRYGTNNIYILKKFK